MTVELLAPEGATLESAAATIAGALSVRERAGRAHDRSYYDTFDGLLHARDAVLVHEGGELVLVRDGVERARAPLRRPRRPFLVAELAPGALRDALASMAGVRALLPLARIHSRERAVDLLDDERKTVVRGRLSAPATTPDGNGVAGRLRPRLSLEGVRGYDGELEALQRRLLSELGFAAAECSLLDEAVRARGGEPGGVSAKVGVALGRGEPAAAAVAAVLSRLLEVIETNLRGTLEDVDSEFLHDLRVAVRRTRAVLRELRGVFEPGALARFRAEFRWVQAVTGPARDLDVHLLEFDDYRALVAPRFRSDLDPVAELLAERRRRALRDLRRALRGRVFGDLLEDWRGYLARLPGSSSAQGPDGARPIDELVAERVARVYRRMVRDGRAIGPGSPPEALHELRKQGKELRYLFELFAGPLFGEQTVTPLVRTLKSLQDVLGRHQDRAVQAAMLASLTAELARRPGGPAALVATGALAQQLLDDEHGAREEFTARFRPFAAKATRQLVREALR